jgi:hypothetical protein
MKENGIKHVVFSTADGALEAAPAVRFSTKSLTFGIKLLVFFSKNKC